MILAIVVLIFAFVGPPLALVLWLCSLSLYTGEFLLRELYFEQAFETEFIVSFFLAGMVFCTSVLAISRHRASELSSGIRGLIGAASMTFVIMTPSAYWAFHGRGVDLGDMIFLYAMALPCGVLGLSMPIDRMLLRRKNDA